MEQNVNSRISLFVRDLARCLSGGNILQPSGGGRIVKRTYSKASRICFTVGSIGNEYTWDPEKGTSNILTGILTIGP